MICNIKKFFFAVDLGAISGRIIFGSLLNDSLSLKELSRFPIKYLTLQEKYYWDIYYLFEEIKKGLIKVSRQGIQIESVGIDAWAVDFIYIAKVGTLLNLPR
jgi:rhamnulokinase